MDKNAIIDHLYNDNIPQAVKFVKNLNDEASLFTYSCNYNWDNGFEVPQAILQNKNCSLSIALFLFHSADGILYLESKETADGTESWLTFPRGC